MLCFKLLVAFAESGRTEHSVETSVCTLHVQVDIAPTPGASSETRSPAIGANSVHYTSPCVMQFFQTNQPDKGFDEAVTLATVAAVIWLIFKVYAELEKLP